MDDEDDIDIMGEFQDDAISAEASSYDGMSLNLAELLPDLGPNSWLLSCNQNWNLDSDIESRSKTQVEHAVKNEESCDKVNELSFKTQKHRKFWNTTEKELFLEGFKRYGNKWSKISKLLGTRTTLQVKSFARQFLKQSSVLGHGAQMRQVENIPQNLNDSWPPDEREEIKNVKTDLIPSSPKQEMPLMEEVSSKLLPKTAAEEVVRLHRENSFSDNEEVDIEGLVEESDTETNFPESKAKHIETKIINEEFKYVAYQSQDELSECFADKIKQDFVDSEETEKSEDAQFDVIDRLRTFRFAVPEQELYLDRDVTTLNEKLIHHEFFEGRPQKTPERYLKIRNYILDSWEKCKPNYLNKTSVRPGLKNCGDVNCIGRIHTYLEQIGAINFGCEQTVYSETLLVDGSKKILSVAAQKKPPVLTFSKQFERTETMRPRKRKVPDLSDGGENHGYTIEHGDNGEIIDVAAVVKQQKRRKAPSNPFHLIPCCEFSPSQPAPYSVEMSVRAVMIMDVHAHLSTLEVIGLLGGRYDFNNSTLYVLQAEPCRSISTGLECEMDPVSQTVASERIQQEGCSVVGWYHSHPTFAPNPSVRDLDTQTKFQHWFSQGGTPFLGVIVSPHMVTSPFSKFRYLMVDTECVATAGCHQPFKFGPAFVWNSEESASVEDHIVDIAKRLLATSDEYKMSMLSVKKIISGVHRHLTAAGMDLQTRTSILTNFGKHLVDIATPQEQPANQTEIIPSEFSESPIESDV